MMPRGEQQTTLAVPLAFWGFIQAFLRMSKKTQSNQVARSAPLSNQSITFCDRVSLS
jgi:hypothetical protein